MTIEDLEDLQAEADDLVQALSQLPRHQRGQQAPALLQRLAQVLASASVPHLPAGSSDALRALEDAERERLLQQAGTLLDDERRWPAALAELRAALDVHFLVLARELSG